MGSTQGTLAPNRGGADGTRGLVARQPRTPLSPHVFTTVPVPKGRTRHDRTSGIPLLDALGSGEITLGAPAGRGLANRTDDVRTVQLALNSADIPVKVDGLFGPRTEDAVRTAQRQLNGISDIDGAITSLKVDGRIDPRGPTQRAVRGLARRVVAQTRMPSTDKPPPWWRTQDLGRVKDDTVSANRRTADHLRTVGTDGEIPVYAADAIRTKGDKAVSEFADLLRQIEKNDPARARGLDEEVRKRLGRGAEMFLPAPENGPPIFKPEVPWAKDGFASKRASGPRKRAPSWSDETREVAKGVLGPAYRQFEALANAFESFSPGADIKDMLDGSRETAEGIAKGDFADALAGGAKTLGGMVGMAAPGSYSGYRKAVDHANKAADGIKLPKISKTESPFGRKDFDSLPNTGFVDPNRIRTMQDKIKAEFKDGRSVEQMANDLKTGNIQPSDVEPIRIAIIDGKAFTLDHRRLVAHRLAGWKVKYRKAAADEVRRALKNRKMTTHDSGMSISIELGRRR